MKLFRFYLPELDNGGADMSAAHTAFKRYLLAKAGGLTELNAQGQWSDGSRVYCDKLRVYEVGFSNVSDERDAFERATECAMTLWPDQKAVFTAEIGVAHAIERVTV